MKYKEVESLFTLAHIQILRIWELPNQYYPIREGDDDESILQNAIYRARRPWWLVKTHAGCIEIGWRKRVIQIDWSDTPIRKKMTEEVNVTSHEHYVHAWTEMKAVEYLQALSKEIYAPPVSTVVAS